MYHVEVVSEISKKNKLDLVGFHGQTIYHNAVKKFLSSLVMEIYYQNSQKKILFIILEKMILKTEAKELL